MAIRSGFFNSVSGDRKYDAKRFAEYFASFIGNGVFPNPSDNLQVISNNNMTVTVRPGKAWINGYILVNDDDYILSIDVADGVLKRIDRIVARYDVANRGITLAVKKGIFASTPSAPALQRDEDIYELGIADILISNGAVSITQGNITDLRMNSTYCGIVTGVVDQIDATNLFAQYDAEFRDWFAGLEDVLDENVAANLLNLINAHKAEYATNAHNAGNISFTPPEGMTANDLQVAVEEVFTLGNNVKSDTVDALLQVDDSLPIDAESSWGGIINAIGQIETGIAIVPGNDIYLFGPTSYASYSSTTTVFDKVVQKRGIYRVEGEVSSSSIYKQFIRVYVNGVQIQYVGSDTSNFVKGSWDIELNVGDRLTINAAKGTSGECQTQNISISIAGLMFI